MKRARLTYPRIFAIFMTAALGILLTWLGIKDITSSLASGRLRDQVYSEDYPWPTGERSIDDMEALPASQFVYLELVEEHTDTFSEQLAKVNFVPPPAPYLFKEGTLFIDKTLLRSTDPEMNIFTEGGRSAGRNIFLTHWSTYAGVGRRYLAPTFYQLNEPSRAVFLEEAFQPAGPLHFDPFDTFQSYLEVKLTPVRSFAFLDADAGGSVRFLYDGVEAVVKPGEHFLLGENTFLTEVTALSPYGTNIDYGEITFKTTLTLYNYGTPTQVQWLDAGDTPTGGQQTAPPIPGVEAESLLPEVEK